MMDFTKAIDFLTNVLRIENVDEKLRHQRMQLLNEYVSRFHQTIPFQNVTTLQLEPEERDLPTMDKMIRNCSSGIGGMCLTLNGFTNNLLSALGYDSFQVLCSCPFVTKEYTHAATVVRNVEKDGELYFVDVGASFPTFQPIPIHDLPQEYHNAYLKFKFVKEGNTVARYHVTEKGGVQEWRKFYYFEPVPRTEAFIQQYQRPIYTKVGHGDAWYLVGVRMAFYPDDTAISINDYTLKVWRKGDGLETIHLKDKRELESAIRSYFPMLKGADIPKALTRMIHGVEN